MLLVSANEHMSGETAGRPHAGPPSSSYVQTVHRELLGAMAEMAIAFEAASPDRESYTRARWRFSKAGRRRLRLWEAAYAFLLVRVGSAELEQLSQLLATNAALRAATNDLSHWSAEAVDADWKGYCHECRMLRWVMMSLVRDEQRVVIPMLEKFEKALR